MNTLTAGSGWTEEQKIGLLWFGAAAVITVALICFLAFMVYAMDMRHTDGRLAKRIEQASRTAIEHRCVALARFIRPDLPESELGRLDEMEKACVKDGIERRLNLLRSL